METSDFGFSADESTMPNASEKKAANARDRSVIGKVYPSKAVATRVALWPPKPKELFMITRTFFSFASFGV